MVASSVLLIACRSSTAPENVPRDAAFIYDSSSSIPVFGYVGPTPIRRAGVTFEVVVNTFRGDDECWIADRVEVRYVGTSVAIATPYNRKVAPTDPRCLFGKFAYLQHAVPLLFARSGEKHLIVQGREVGTLKGVQVPLPLSVSP